MLSVVRALGNSPSASPTSSDTKRPVCGREDGGGVVAKGLRGQVLQIGNFLLRIINLLIDGNSLYHLNTTFSADWPNITRKKDSPADADEHKGEEGKYDKYFTPDPGTGD